MPEVTNEAPKTIAERALESGENTSEGKAIAEGSKSANFLTKIGLITTALTLITDNIGILPDSIQNSRFGIIGIAIVSGTIAFVGIVKDTFLKISYANSRSQIKAAALIDQSPKTPTGN